MRLHHRRTLVVPGIAALALGLGACQPKPDPAAERVQLHSAALTAGAALFVVGNTSLSAADSAARSRLESLGFSVTVKLDSVATTTDASGKALVVISASVDSGDVNTKYRTVAVPVLTWERLLYDDLAMTASTPGSSGTITGQVEVSVVDGRHPLSAGLNPGAVSVGSAPTAFGWGIPAASAAVVATLADDPTRATIFGYETGAPMVGLTAPARRAALFMADSTAASLTGQGWSLFDASVRWARGLVPTVSITSTDGTAAEAGPDHGSFTITRTGDLSGALTVHFRVAGTAANGVDFASLSELPGRLDCVVTLDPGDASRVVTVTVLDDSVGEGPEIASFTLQKDWHYSVSSSQTRATVLIADDDQAPARGTLLFVVGSTSLNPGDQAVLSRLQSQGYSVVVKSPPAVGLADGMGKDATLISSTVDSASVGNSFRNAPYPVMVWESSLWDDMGMVPTSAGSYGTTAGQTQLQIVKPDQPPAAGLEGAPAVASSAQTVRWAIPNQDAITVASLAGDTSKASIFGYDAGVMLPAGFRADARRVGFFLADTTAAALTTYGWMLFDATVSWTIGKVHEETLGSFETTPAADHLWLMPVVVVNYIPTQDGVHKNRNLSGFDETVQVIRDRVATADIQVKFTLEEGSRFRGYKDPAARPSLGYKIVKVFTIYEPMPVSNFEYPFGSGRFRPDYWSVLERIGGRDFVDTLGVKEFWVWGYHHGDIEPSESNMSSALTGDVSNSEGADDLPIYSKSFVVYGYNWGSGMENAVHNHGHQLEAILSHANATRDLEISNRRLFWQSYSGQDEFHQHIVGRCGWTHTPPNTTMENLHHLPDEVESDCEDWTPAGTGQKKLVSVATWRDIPYAWPGGVLPSQIPAAHFYIWWMQNMPGRDNGIRYPEADTVENGQATLNNWWIFTGDWEAAHAAGAPGLVTHTPAP